MKQIIVAGCGPAGMMAAIAAAREGVKVTILEGMEKPGKKLLVTGNGRCNLTNLDPELPRKYHSVSSPEIANTWVQQVLSQFSVADTLDFFHELGLLTADRGGYVYPYTSQSSSVLELLLAELRRLKVKLKFTEKIEKIEKTENGWKVHTGSWAYSCDSLILCCGSKAAKNTGSDGSGYELACQAGHRISDVVPSLTALTGKEKWFSLCAGVRCHGRVTLHTKTVRWEKVAEDTGELQWTDNGISGIVVFQVSRYAALALERGQQVKAELDFLPETEEDRLAKLLCRGRERFPGGSAGEVFSGILPKKLLQVCLEQNKIKPGCQMAALSEKQCLQLAKTMKHFLVPVTGVRSFDQCQVCAGGVSLTEVFPDTLESRLASGLYFAGEILDVDGPCGGYNLQWAWSSGYAAGKHAAV